MGTGHDIRASHSNRAAFASGSYRLLAPGESLAETLFEAFQKGDSQLIFHLFFTVFH